jgi:uncharacterized protein (TIGR03067 family)
MAQSALSLGSSVSSPCHDLANLQGEWITIEGRRAGQLLITGQHYMFRFMDGTIYKGTLELLPDASPQAMHMHIEDGPPKHRGKSAWCIYELEVGRLRWCPTEPGSEERLSGFPDLDDPRYLSTIFRRDIVDPD